MIYLDAAATTKVQDTVIDAMNLFFRQMWQNPSALYRGAVTVRDEVDKARKVVADFINADSDEIIFTSSGSESNCTAIQGFVNKCHHDGKIPTIVTTRIEHKSVLLCAESVADDLYYVDVDKEGFVDITMLERILQHIPDSNVLVSIQFANNEIGTVQHIKDISDMVHKYGAIFHTDAVQAYGHEPIDVKAMGIDLLSASGHKIGAPKGVGFLYKKRDISIFPLIFGTQEGGLRGGTENTPYIVGFSKATTICNENFEKIAHKITLLRDRLLKELIALGCTVNGSMEHRLANNINVTFKQAITGEALIYLLDASGICISAGSACNSHSQSVSHVLKAIGLSETDAMRTIRITLPDDFTADDIDYVISEFKKAILLLDISA